ncbi:DUF6493 family protein [Nonomuraea sp. NPDC050680]|uniref:DUF7824 domain-containing protein n=1 Tax=Nonomuraea sp. NPDC050680 TaxID=3154630 RepID=UPI0033C92BD2
MSAWEIVEEAIATRDAVKVAEIVLGLDDQGRKEVAQRLSGHLLPLIFEAEGVGRALQGEWVDPLSQGSWPASLAELQREGLIDRELLLDGCVRRFLRGGQAGDLRFFARLHELVEPAHAEVEARARDYLRLLPAAPAAVAELALRHLRRLGTLDPADVAEALQALLFRPERKLVSIGLSWLDQAVRDAADDADDYALALAYAFACDAPDVQERAVRLALKHSARFTPAGAEVIRDALGLLPPDLGEHLVAVFGGEVAADEDDDGFVPVPLPGTPQEDAGFPLIGDIRELGAFPEREDWQGAERWLAGFVRFCTDDRDLLRSVLARWTSWPTRLDVQPEWRFLDQWSEAMARQIVTPETWLGRSSSLLPSPVRVSPPHLFLLRRWAEVHAALRAGTLPPYLLATPTSGTGHLDPGVLVDRLDGYERTGAKVMDADLWQALLRLPRSVAPEVAARAGRLTSAAGATAARWMSGGRPAPVTAVEWTRGSTPYAGDREPSGGEHPDLVPRIALPYGGSGPLRDLLDDPSASRRDGHGGYLPWWPAVLPSDREAVALHCLPFLLYHWNAPEVEPGMLWALARADGPAGEGVALLLAYFLVERDSWSGGKQPNEGVRVLVEMAGRGDLPAAEVGRQLALLLRRTWYKLSAVVESLESAARHGAHLEVWEVVAGFLEVYLPGPGERPRTAHTQALGFAVRAASWAGARGELPCVAEIARRKGSSGFAREARRLHARLT